MKQIHGLRTVLEDQGTAPPTYSYLAPKHFHFVITKAFHLEFVSLCVFGAIIFYVGPYYFIKRNTIVMSRELKILSIRVLKYDVDTVGKLVEIIPGANATLR